MTMKKNVNKVSSVFEKLLDEFQNKPEVKIFSQDNSTNETGEQSVVKVSEEKGDEYNTNSSEFNTNQVINKTITEQ